MPRPLSPLAIALLLGSLVPLQAPEISAAALHQPAQSGMDTALAASPAGPLARQLQGKPVVVDVYASWCPACRNIAPTLAQLRQTYANRVHFVVFDVSDKARTEASMANAQRLGLAGFLKANRTQTGLVAIIDPATGRILAQHRNNADASAYTTVLNNALAK
jgi:thiol-disulfide isomerase/thioredoxin